MVVLGYAKHEALGKPRMVDTSSRDQLEVLGMGPATFTSFARMHSENLIGRGCMVA